MKYLNLTKGFNPFDVLEEDCIQFESFFFKGGEPHIKLDRDSFSREGEGYMDVTVTSRITSMNEFMMLIVASEALSECGIADKRFLFIPYFPGARQDRRMMFGEPLSVKIFANIINDLGYNNVETFDNHSDVSTALIDNCTNHDNHRFVKECISYIFYKDPIRKREIALISPDAGSNKKIKELASFLNEDYHIPVVKCDKTRNLSDGSITGFEVYTNDLKGADCYIVDDICDGGGTFIGLAKELKEKNAGDIYLIVSHGIFSRELSVLNKYFKKIYTTDSWISYFSWEREEREPTDLVEIVKFKDFM